MQLQDLKWWGWAIIGLLIGLGLSYSYTNWDRSNQLTGGSPAQFQQLLLRRYTRAEGDPPYITDIRLRPTVAEGYTRITYYQLDPRQQKYIPYEINTRSPYRVDHPNGTQYNRRNPAPDVRTYLDAVKEANPDAQLEYGYAFWEEPRFLYPIVTGASVLLIGGVWPMILNLLVGAGFGRPPRQEEEYDLDRFGKGKPEPAASTPGADPAAEEAELASVTAAYEQRLAANVDEDEEIESAIAEAEATQPEIRKLTVGPPAAETATPAKEEEEDVEREYGGEFYPVVRKYVRKDDHGH